jgi:hypothetical protein
MELAKATGAQTNSSIISKYSKLQYFMKNGWAVHGPTVAPCNEQQNKSRTQQPPSTTILATPKRGEERGVR